VRMKRLKLLLLPLAGLCQILGVILLFVNIKMAIVLFIVYGIALVTIFILLINDRRKEKREDDENDYRNY
jgi:membrane protein implicated in regulation of membrane protease activity